MIFPNLENVKVFGCFNETFNIKKDFSEEKFNIISNEGFSGWTTKYMYGASRSTITKRLHCLFPDAKIILVLRNKENWIKSLYSEYIKHGGIEFFDKWYDKLFDHTLLDFNEYIKQLKDLFPEVLILHFEDLKNDPDIFVKNICKFIGVNIPNYSNVLKNVKLGESQLKRWRKVNTYFKSINNPNGKIPFYLNPLWNYEKLLRKIG